MSDRSKNRFHRGGGSESREGAASLLTTKKSPLSEGRFGAPLDTRGYPMVYLLDSKDAVWP